MSTSSPPRVLLTIAATGCLYGPVEDRWSPAREACPDAPWDPGEVPPDECRAVLLDDLELHEPTFETLSAEDRILVEDRLAAAMWRLATLPMGDREDLDQPYLSDDLRQKLPRFLDASGEEALEAGFYNYVAHWVVKTVHEDGTGAQYKNGKLWAFEPGEPHHADVVTLIHEARHHAPPGHVRCEAGDEELHCDRIFDEGANGWSASASFLRAATAPDDLAGGFTVLQFLSEDDVFDLGGPDWPRPPSSLQVVGPWHYIGDDVHVGPWVEGSDATSGSACVAAVDFDAAPATAWRIERVDFSSESPRPERVALSGEEARWAHANAHEDDEDDSAWVAMDPEGPVVPLAGPAHVTFSWPYGSPPVTAEDGEAQCQEIWPEGTVVDVAIEWYRASPRIGAW